jgi:osmotically-inducible protein OsmY
LFDIHVDTFNGIVYIRGIVASQSTIDEAVTVARSVAGVKSVKNEMRVM